MVDYFVLNQLEIEELYNLAPVIKNLTSDLLQKFSDQEKFELKKHKNFNSTKPTNNTFKRTKCRKGAKTLKPF